MSFKWHLFAYIVTGTIQYMNKIHLNIHDNQLKPFIFSLQVTNLMKTRSETTRLSWKELITSFCSLPQLGVQGWTSPISYRPSTAMQRRRRCGFLKRLNRCSLLIMDMILIVPCCCWTSMRLVHYIMKLNRFNTVNSEGVVSGQHLRNILNSSIAFPFYQQVMFTLVIFFLRLWNERWPNATLTQRQYWKVAKTLWTLDITHLTLSSLEWSVYRTSG